MTIEKLPSTTTDSRPYRVSNSEIQTFKDCRRKWWFNYYRRLQPKARKYTGPLALGTRVHAALDDYYSNETDLLKSYSDLLAADRVEAEKIDQWGMDEFESEGELGRIMLEGYLEWVDEEGIDSDLEMISTEETLTMPLHLAQFPDDNVELQGKLDMRVRRKADGVRMFRDFKTVGQSFEQYASTSQLNEQILTYMTLEAYQNKDGERSAGGIFTLLKKVKRSARAKPPFYDQYEVNHNVFTLRSFWQRLHGEVSDLWATKKALDAGGSHLYYAYPRPNNDCRWKCPFFAICPMTDDGSAVEAAIENLYEVGNPNARYGDDEKKGSE